jgi:hypothetical protein
MAGIRIKVDETAFGAVIDEEVIDDWIESRLNDARTYFLKQLARGGGSGRVYPRGKKHKHLSSAPGEYPVGDSGGLGTSVDTQALGNREGEISSELKYAEYLQDGTPKGQMKPRKMFIEALTESLSANPATADLEKAVTFEKS